MTEEQYDHSSIISEVESLQRIAKEFGEKPKKVDEEDRTFYGTKIRMIPVLLALAVELGLKALYCQETKEIPRKTHDLVKLFNDLGGNVQKGLESRFEKSGGLGVARLEAMMLPRPQSQVRYVLRQNKNVFMDWRYSFEHRGLFCYTGELDRLISAIIETYYKLSR